MRHILQVNHSDVAHKVKFYISHVRQRESLEIMFIINYLCYSVQVLLLVQIYIKMFFLDGKPGTGFAFIQAFFYRFLVDAKIYEKEFVNDNSKE